MKNTGRDRRRIQDPVTNEEQVFAASFSDVPKGVEHDALGVAIGPGLRLRELRAQVIPAGLGKRRKGVRRSPAPTRNGHVYSVDECLVTEVSAPVPGDDERLDGDAHWIESHLLTRPYRDRPEIARPQVVSRHGFHRCLHELIDRPPHGHPIDPARVVEASHVLPQAENRTTGRRLVTANPLEHARSVVDDMTHHVNRGVPPVHELAVTPDLRGSASRAIGHLPYPVVCGALGMITTCTVPRRRGRS